MTPPRGEQRATETSEVAVASDLVQGRDGMLNLGEPVSSFLLQHPIGSHPLNLSASGLLFCQITSKEREAGKKDVVMDKELDKSFQEPPVGEFHTLTPIDVNVSSTTSLILLFTG